MLPPSRICFVLHFLQMLFPRWPLGIFPINEEPFLGQIESGSVHSLPNKNFLLFLLLLWYQTWLYKTTSRRNSRPLRWPSNPFNMAFRVTVFFFSHEFQFPLSLLAGSGLGYGCRPLQFPIFLPRIHRATVNIAGASGKRK